MLFYEYVIDKQLNMYHITISVFRFNIHLIFNLIQIIYSMIIMINIIIDYLS